MIKYWGYPFEKYEVITKDGYILDLYRIPHGRNETPSKCARDVIFFAHGLPATSAEFLLNPPEQSPGERVDSLTETSLS